MIHVPEARLMIEPARGERRPVVGSGAGASGTLHDRVVDLLEG